MITIYGGDSPNVIKGLIALEELGFAYARKPVDIMAGEQFTPAFLAISPNNRIPAIVDDAPADGGDPISVFESGAILIYLAEKADAFLPHNARERSAVFAWLMWQMAGQGPMVGQAGHFRNYAPEKIPYAIKRYTDEAARLYRVLDTRLAEREFVAGEFSIADIACWPWLLFRDHHGIRLEDYPNAKRWFHRVRKRPGVSRAVQGIEISPPAQFDDATKRTLFNIAKD